MAELEGRDAFRPPEVFTHIDDHGKQMWGWRCWGANACDGWVGRDLSSQQAAHQEMDRHVVDEHREPTP